MNSLTCDNCGDQFLAVKCSARFCSVKCNQQARKVYKDNKIPLLPKECLHCNSVFQPRSANHAFCSKVCSRQSPTQQAYLGNKRRTDPEWTKARHRVSAAWARNNPTKVMHMRSRKRASNAGIPFTIVESDIVIPDDWICPVLGIKMTHGVPGKSAGPNPTSMSLDRLDNSKGYIPGNVRVISDRANRLKNNATAEELEAILKYMRSGEHDEGSNL